MPAPLPPPRPAAPGGLPRLAVTDAAATAPVPPADGAAARILLVEDDPAIRALFANFLRHAGYIVMEAADGAAALALLDGGAPPVDLLVTDVVMPRTGGPALVADARVRQPGMRVLYVSGYVVQTEAADAATPGTAHLPKPLTRSTLLAAVAAMCGPGPTAGGAAEK